MPSWNDGETSSEDNIFVESSTPVNVNVPETLYDPDFCGIERDSALECDHLGKLMKYVAFEGENTGRKFLGCTKPGGDVCSTIIWLDPEWPVHLKKCLVRIWEMYELESAGRVRDTCENVEAYYKLTLENRQLQEDKKNLLQDLSKLISEHKEEATKGSQVATVSQQLLDLHKMLRQKAEKQRDELKEEKKKLEYYIADLLKAGEVNKDKLKKMKAILDE